MTNPRPAYSAAVAVQRAIERAKARDGQYALGSGDWRPGWTQPYTTANSGLIGSDCVGFAINWSYGIPRHRPGFNRSSGKLAPDLALIYDVEDDINCNSAMGDARGDRDLFVEVPHGELPQLGDLLCYPTIKLASHPNMSWPGHVGIVVGTDRALGGWKAGDPPNYELLDVAQCCGPDARKPAVLLTDGAYWRYHDHDWPLPEHRTAVLRVKP